MIQSDCTPWLYDAFAILGILTFLIWGVRGIWGMTQVLLYALGRSIFGWRNVSWKKVKKEPFKGFWYVLVKIPWAAFVEGMVDPATEVRSGKLTWQPFFKFKKRYNI